MRTVELNPSSSYQWYFFVRSDKREVSKGCDALGSSVRTATASDQKSGNRKRVSPSVN